MPQVHLGSEVMHLTVVLIANLTASIINHAATVPRRRRRPPTADGAALAAVLGSLVVFGTASGFSTWTIVIWKVLQVAP